MQEQDPDSITEWHAVVEAVETEKTRMVDIIKQALFVRGSNRAPNIYRWTCIALIGSIRT
jgi:hypothetical protein